MLSRTRSHVPAKHQVISKQQNVVQLRNRPARNLGQRLVSPGRSGSFVIVLKRSFAVDTKQQTQEDTFSKYKKVIKEGAKFYWGAVKQLYFNWQTARLYRQKRDAGTKLTRAETRHIVQHRADMGALIPFVVIWALPGSAFLLPLMIKFAPNLLPSTLKDSSQHAAAKQSAFNNRLQLIPAILALYKSELSKNSSSFGISKEEQQSFASTFKKIESKQVVTIDELKPLSENLRKIIDVNELPRDSLLQIGSFVGVWTLGLPSPWLRTGIKKRFNRIRADDTLLTAEGGVSKLTDSDVVDANNERALPPVATEATRKNLEEWAALTASNAPIAVYLLHSASSLNSSNTTPVVPK